MKEKTAFITGASGGIGKAIVEALLESGYRLYACAGKHADELDGLKSRYQDSLHILTGDISDAATVKGFFNDVTSLDLLINCAGISYVGLLQDMTDEDWKTTMGINLDSVFFCCREAIPLFLKNSCGRIINISSVWGNVGASTEVAYSASKGGMNSLTKALAKELAPSGIAVNALACGFIDTKMNSHLSDEEKQAVIDEIPACRMCTVSEVADAVCLLAQMPVYMTGQIITIDGGWT
ncbi:MAG: SDR family NAD(P)-dependent oxidoreductase [Lachnospiraceae bacterium]|nr:SDR family NAD(P)-dependent oxidoreductase [Lachnospiraceae bacterium]